TGTFVVAAVPRPRPALSNRPVRPADLDATFAALLTGGPGSEVARPSFIRTAGDQPGSAAAAQPGLRRDNGRSLGISQVDAAFSGADPLAAFAVAEGDELQHDFALLPALDEGLVAVVARLWQGKQAPSSRGS